MNAEELKAQLEVWRAESKLRNAQWHAEAVRSEEHQKRLSTDEEQKP